MTPVPTANTFMATRTLQPGAHLGKYQVETLIAPGGMGKVYKARDTILGRTVALKVLSADLASKPSALERFRREARNAARLAHKNVVTLYEYGEIEGLHYLALEYVEGIDLYEYIERKGQLEPEEARRILLQAAKALHHAFEHGVIHRDIKPSNFLLAVENDRLRVKLTDMGLARKVDDDDEFRVTRAGSTVGTIDYLSPEQARDSASADVRSDIYSLGCTFYHMLAGHPPFAEGGLGERVYKHMTVDPPDVREANPHVSEGMWKVLQKMLAKKPEDRYQTPAELLEDLKRVGGNRGPVRAIHAKALRPRHATQTPPSSDDGIESSPTVTPPPAAAKLPPAPPTSKPSSSAASQPIAIRDDPALLGLSLEQVQAAAAQFERAQQAATKGNLEYALELLLSCCKLDPLTPSFRQKLREIGRRVDARKGTGLLGGWISTLSLRGRFRAARKARDVRKTLEYGEELLLRNPVDMKTHVEMAEAAEQAGLTRLAAWLLEQSRVQDPEYVPALRALALLYERLKDFHQAIAAWEALKKLRPHDGEAARKVQHLSANYAMSRGRFKG
jgi:serine/threonine protein kinase